MFGLLTWNGQFDALQRPNRAVPDRGSVLKNNVSRPAQHTKRSRCFLGHSVDLTAKGSNKHGLLLVSSKVSVSQFVKYDSVVNV